MFEWILNRFKSDDDLTFKAYLKKHKNAPLPELVQNAYAFELTIPALLTKHYPHLAYSDIERMKIKDINFRIRTINKSLVEELLALEAFAKQSGKVTRRSADEAQWQYALTNTGYENV